MKPIDKETLLASLEQQVEQQIQAVVETFQNMDEAALQNPSPTGGWSIDQCLSHLTSYGHYYLPYIRKGLDSQHGRPTRQLFRSSWLGSYLIGLMNPATGTKKFKAIKRHLPIDGLPPHQIVAEFIDQQEELLRYLEQARSADLNAVRIPLSLAGWLRLNLGEILQFMVAHNERHIQQAKRNVNVDVTLNTRPTSA